VKLTGRAALLLIPSALLFVFLLVLPLVNVIDESFKEFIPGRIGSAKDAPYTLANYLDFFSPAYAGLFLDTFRLGLIACVVALAVSFPIAYYTARQPAGLKRKLAIGFLVCMMFLSALVRVYSIELTFGPLGFLKQISALFGFTPNSRAYLEMLTISGLVHVIIPMSALILIGTIQNINPRLVEAGQALGAPRWKAHLSITVPLSAPGILSAFLISYTLCISAFVVPLILGKGRLLFISNLIYSRFSEVANYPSGAAMSMVLLVISLLIIYGVSRFATFYWKTE